MITEKDLQEAIAECEGERHPNASTCIKLAAFYTIREHLFPDAGKNEEMGSASYSYASGPVETTINFNGDSEFAKAVNGRDLDEIWPLIDELVSVVRLVTPRIYDSFLEKLR